MISTRETQVETRGVPHSAPAPANPPVIGALQQAERGLEYFGHLIAFALVVIFCVWGWFASRELRLWFDELVQIAVANAPTYSQVSSFLKVGIETDPPLSYYLTRVSMALLGGSDFAARLPAFLGFVTMLVCMYSYVSRWLGRSYGVLAMLVIMCLPVRDYAWTARPYGLILGFCGLALLFHRQAASGRGRILGLVGLSICTGCLTASHYYGILAVGPFLILEAVRLLQSKKVDWAIVAASAAPPLLVLAALRPLWSAQFKVLAHYWGRGNLLSFNTGYVFLAMDPMIYSVALLLIAAVVAFSHESRASKGEVTVHQNVTTQGAYLGAGFLLLPIIGAVLTQFVTHAYAARYFLVSAIGFALCLCYAARLFSALVPGVAVLLVLATGLGFGREMMRVLSHPGEQLTEGQALGGGDVPVLFDSASDYMQVYHYYPALRDRLWVIADPAASLKYRAYDTDDKAMLALASKGGAQAITLTAAVQRWSHFSLVPRPGDYVWALKCVMESGAGVEVQNAFVSSWPNQGKTNFVYDVTVTPENLDRIYSCSPTSGR